MNQLEQFREQCANVLDEVGAKLQVYEKSEDYWAGVGQTVEAAENAIRALPLPEVMCEPVAWFRDLNEEPISAAYKNCRKDDFYQHHTIPCYLLPPDAEALRSENEQLRQCIKNVRTLIRDDAFAITFQTMGQYRSALLKGI